MFFRRQPFAGGFSIFAGLETLLEHVAQIRFDADDLDYLQRLGVFRREFLDFLAGLRFQGDIWAMAEGTPVFPGEPLVRVRAPLIQAQLVESALLTILNFQTLIATKAARVCLAAGEAEVIEFGLRRAPGVDGALSASRAAFVGGATATSNTLAGRLYGIPVRGTMAHSWVMAFASEREAFESYAALYPRSAILLIDTYDTLGSGIENAVAVGRALPADASFGVRLDSGDLEYLSRRVRERLDAAGLRHARIIASNELDEHIIQHLAGRRVPIDSWGVGTSLVTGAGAGGLSGVYKMAAREAAGAWVPTIKVSNNPEKVTNPGIKQVWRFSGPDGGYIADLIGLEGEEVVPGRPHTFHHPAGDSRSFVVEKAGRIEPLLLPWMRDGQRVRPREPLAAIQARTRAELGRLDDTFKRFVNPHVYRVSLSDSLQELKARLVRETRARGGTS